MDDALLGQMLQHPPGGQLVVFGIDEAAGNSFEAFNEGSEVVEAVESLSLA